MKIETGKYIQQISFGITFINYYNEYRALIIDFGIWYIEFIFGDYSREQ